MLRLGHGAPYLLAGIRQPAGKHQGPAIAVAGQRAEILFACLASFARFACSLVDRHSVSPPRRRDGLPGVETVTPRGPVRGQPVIDLTERLGPQPVQAPLGVGSHLDQARLAQHAQVLRYAGLGDPQSRGQAADRLLPFAQQIEDAPPVTVRQHLKHAANIIYRVYNCQGIYSVRFRRAGPSDLTCPTRDGLAWGWGPQVPSIGRGGCGGAGGAGGTGGAGARGARGRGGAGGTGGAGGAGARGGCPEHPFGRARLVSVGCHKARLAGWGCPMLRVAGHRRARRHVFVPFAAYGPGSLWLIRASWLIGCIPVPPDNRRTRIHHNKRRIPPPGVAPAMSRDERDGQREGRGDHKLTVAPTASRRAGKWLHSRHAPLYRWQGPPAPI